MGLCSFKGKKYFVLKYKNFNGTWKKENRCKRLALVL